MPMPTYEELKRRSDAPAGSSWGLFGDLGTIGRLTPEIKKAAIRTVQTGETFNLDWPINAFDPPPSPTRRIISSSATQTIATIIWTAFTCRAPLRLTA
jgi:hypothetical protein